MIFKRAVAKMRAQDWTAVTIELAIVVLGVFLGMWVANRNQDRQAADQVRQTLIQLTPELRQLEEFSASAPSTTMRSSSRLIKRARFTALTIMGRAGHWCSAPASFATSPTRRFASP
jgi:hypothetical protein